MGQVLFLAFMAALNPTLLAASTVMLLLPSPKKLLFGYLLGAYMTSITIGLVLIFVVEGDGVSGTAKHTISPAMDFAIGALLLIVAYAIGSGRQERMSAKHKAKKEAKAVGKEKKEPRWQRALSKGSARDTFVVGAVLTLPGASYIAGLSEIDKQGLPVAGTVGMVILFNVIMLMLLEIPLLGYALAPARTPVVVRDFKDWLSRKGGRIAMYVALVLGIVLIVRAIIELS